jgi:hypothetical protein
MRNLPLMVVRALPAVLLAAMVADGACTSGTTTPDAKGSGSGSGNAMCNNMGICKPGTPNACMLGSQGSGPMCTGKTYDYCNTGSDCTSGMCHFFMASMFSVCVVTCTPGDNSTCPGG